MIPMLVWVLSAAHAMEPEVQVVVRAPLVTVSDFGTVLPLAGPAVRVGADLGPVSLTGGMGLSGAITTEGGVGGFAVPSISIGAQPELFASVCGRTRVYGLLEPELGLEVGRRGGTSFSQARPWVTAGGGATHWLSNTFGLGAEAGVRVGFGGSGTTVLAGLTGSFSGGNTVDVSACEPSTLVHADDERADDEPRDAAPDQPQLCADFVATSITFDSFDQNRPSTMRMTIHNRGTCDAFGYAGMSGIAVEASDPPSVHPRTPTERIFIEAGGRRTIDYEVEPRANSPHHFQGCGRAVTPPDRNTGNGCTTADPSLSSRYALAPPQDPPTPTDPQPPEGVADFKVTGIWHDALEPDRPAKVRLRVYNAGNVQASGFTVLRVVAAEGGWAQPMVSPRVLLDLPAHGSAHVDFDVEPHHDGPGPYILRGCARATTPWDVAPHNNCMQREPRMEHRGETFPFPEDPLPSTEEPDPDVPCADFLTSGVWVEEIHENRPTRVGLRVTNIGTCTASGTYRVSGEFFDGGFARDGGDLPMGPVAPGQTVMVYGSMTPRHSGHHFVRGCATAADDGYRDNDCMQRPFASGSRMP